MIPLRDQEIIRQKFAQELIGPVKIELFTEREIDLILPGRKPCQTCKPARDLVQELAGLSERISLRVHIWSEAVEERKRVAVELVPTIVLRGQDARLYKFAGLPSGAQFPVFIETIVDISRNRSVLSAAATKSLRRLKDKLAVKVFVTPSCPYSPQMARAAYQLALTSPKIQAQVIEASEFPEAAQQYGVQAVPLTLIEGRIAIVGAVPEEALAEQVVRAATTSISERPTVRGPTSPLPQGEVPQPAQRGESRRPSGLIIP